MEYGIIGEKLGHSFSKEIYETYFDMDYSVKELRPEEVAPFLQKKDFRGINVTIPYKQTVMPYLDKISDAARKIGAVNVVVNENGRLLGYSTDFLGMKANIEYLGISLKDKNVLILGDGGTAKNAVEVAKTCGAKSITKVTREKKSGTITYAEAMTKTDTEIIINTTPVGMFPKIEGSIIDLKYYPALEGVFDAVYNPLCTRLVLDAKKRGIKAGGGLYMLVSQAIFAVEKFKNEECPQSKARGIFNKIYKSKENIVLIGMPGSGKTTIGKILAEKTGREFLDTDEIIKSIHGDIPTIFEKLGEDGFRKIEAEVIRQVSTLQGKVIATGGGAIKRDENIDFLSLNGKVYFIDRPLDKISATPDRPLSKDRASLEKLYNERQSIYLAVCDKQITSEDTAQDTANKILEDFEN